MPLSSYIFNTIILCISEHGLPSQAHAKDSQWDEGVDSLGGNPCWKMIFQAPLNHSQNLRLMNPDIIIPVTSGKKNIH